MSNADMCFASHICASQLRMNVSIPMHNRKIKLIKYNSTEIK